MIQPTSSLPGVIEYFRSFEHHTLSHRLPHAGVDGAPACVYLTHRSPLLIQSHLEAGTPRRLSGLEDSPPFTVSCDAQHVVVSPCRADWRTCKTFVCIQPQQACTLLSHHPLLRPSSSSSEYFCPLPLSLASLKWSSHGMTWWEWASLPGFKDQHRAGQWWHFLGTSGRLSAPGLVLLSSSSPRPWQKRCARMLGFIYSSAFRGTWSALQKPLFIHTTVIPVPGQKHFLHAALLPSVTVESWLLTWLLNTIISLCTVQS